MSSSEEDNDSPPRRRRANNRSSSNNNNNNSSNDVSMSMDDSQDHHDSHDFSERLEYDEPEDNTLRVLISTDNHLGYCETDPVRGLDSFAAFEEVLYLAKLHKVDMVLLGGDLFHHNKPSRRTLHKTMEIMRRYTMGPNPVKIQILSDQARDFRSRCVNYEDAHYSVDLPIFSIHGNHDDPTRDGGNEMLAALDLLSVTNLVNYFGRNDQIDKVEVSPVLIQKGSTRVSLYGLGNLRDERLNRMWSSQKVRFLRPEQGMGEDGGDGDHEDSDDEEQDREWFNIFVLHQNRANLGRGNKNAIHESMIPNWMDFVVFGHEHCSEPYPTESLVGTFRMTQPGSTVATSLTDGETFRKHCLILNVKGSQFKCDPIPLTMVRSFVMTEVALTEDVGLRQDDPKVDAKISRYLEEQLGTCLYNAKEKQKQLLEDAKKVGNYAAEEDSPLVYRLQKRDEVLVRLRVDHAQFSTLNNQRFGAQFVGKVANPGDILLFQKMKKKPGQGGSAGSGKTKKGGKLSDLMEDPELPPELEQVSVERLVKINLESSDQKLAILTEKDLGLALEDYVLKTETGAILDTTMGVLKKRQKTLMKSGEADADGVVSSEKDVREALSRQSQAAEEKEDAAAKSLSKRKRSSSKGSSKNDDDDDDDDFNDDDSGGKENNGAKSRTKSSSITMDSSDDEVVVSTQRSSKSKAAAKKRSSDGRKDSGDIRSFMSTQPQSQSSSKKRKKKPESDLDDDLDEDDEIEVVSVKRAAAPRRRTTKGKVNYSVDVDSDDALGTDSDEDSPPPKKKVSRTRKASPARGKTSGRGRKAQAEESIDIGDDWGSASTRTQR